MRKLFSVIALILLLVSRVTAQSSYPIFVSPNLTPPYSLKLSDYSSFGGQRLVVNVVVNDLNIANLPVKLHIKLETLGVTVENIPNLVTTPIYLDGGATSILMGDDLRDYFDINNLSFKGYSKEAYRRTGQLPEGFYKITVEVHHYQTNRLISNKGTATAWIAIGKPPILKLPENNKELGEFKGMPLTFSWLPCNLGSPISASNVQYKFEMWELRVDGISPYTVAATVPVFFEETTMNTMLNVLPSSLLMTPGMKYAWRVTASDINGFVPFEQDGHSEIRTFTYKSKCETVKNLKSKAKGTNGLFAWTPASNHTSYNIELRKPETGWLSASETFDNKAEFFDLDYGTKYELRVQSVCDNDPDLKSDFSEWVKLETPKKQTPPDSASCPNCGCGTPNGTGNIENIELKKDLKPGDTLVNRYGTTRFIVKSVEQTGDGVYKGRFLFWAELWKLKFVCEYWDLSVNTDKVILNMDFQSVYNPQFLLDVDASTDYLNGLADAIATLTANANIKDTLSVGENVLSYYVNDDGELIAVTADAGGNVTEVVVKNDVDDIEETLITGANGEECVVTRNGDVMGVKEYKATGGGNSRKIDDYIKENEKNHLSNSARVDFSASPNQKYGFDGFTAEKETIKAKYPALANGYIPTYKSVASYTTDRVVPSTSNDKSITFRDQMGISAIKTGDELTVRGGADGTTSALYAYKALTDTTEEIAGKLNLMSFDEQAKKLYIVSVNNARMPDAMELQNLLNKIYGQAVTRWEVVKINKTVELTFPEGQMIHGGSSAISVYNADQKSIISKFKENDNFERDAFYLFFVDNVKGKTGDVAGFMPLQRQVGFIYDSPNLFVVAHELAHGTFNLRHTFSPEEFIANERTTKNLMDYSSGSDIWKHQWELIHDPENMLFAWAQDESEGQMMLKKGRLSDTLLNENKTSFTFISPSGSRVVLPKSIYNVMFYHGIPNFDMINIVTGTLYGFDFYSKTYKASIKDGKFLGYYNNGTPFPVDSLARCDKRDFVLMGLPFPNNFVISGYKTSLDETFNGQASDIKGERVFPVKPYSSENPEYPGKKVVLPYSKSDLFGDQQAFTEWEREVLTTCGEKPELIALLKIAQLHNMYPQYFSDMCYYYLGTGERIIYKIAERQVPLLCPVILDANDWQNLVVQVSEHEDLDRVWQQADKLESYLLFIDKFIEFAKDWNNLKFMLVNDMTINTPKERLVEWLSKMSESEISDFSAKKRILMLNVLAKGTISEIYENEIVKLLSFYRVEKADSILNGLISSTLFPSSKYLIKALTYGVDDDHVFFTENNQLKLVNAIIKLCENSQVYKAEKSAITTENIIEYTVHFSYTPFLNRIWKIAVSKSPYIITSASLSNEGVVSVDQTLHIPTFLQVSEIPITLYKDKKFNSLSPIIFVNKSGLSLLKGFGDNSGAVLPAIIVKYANDKGDSETTLSVINTAIDVAGLFSGYTEIKAGITGMRKAMVILDMLNSSASLLSNATNLDPNSPAAKILAASNALTMGLGVTNANLFKKGDSFETIYKNINDKGALIDVAKYDKLADEVINAPASLSNIEKPALIQVRKNLEQAKTEAALTNNQSLLSKAEDAINKVDDVLGSLWSNYPMLSKLESKTLDKIKDWDKALLESLNKDLADNAKFAENFIVKAAENEGLVESWKVIARKELRTDIDLLTKTDELLKNSDFLNKIKGKDELAKIIEANKRSVCKTCTKITGAEHVSDMNKFLDEVKYFADNYSNITGFEKVIADLKDLGNFYKVEGAAFMMRVMKENPTKYVKSNIKAFDSFINDAEDFCRFDIKLNVGGVDKFFEFKSYKEGFSIGSSTYNQFTSYLKQINSLDELEYVFDMGKISKIDDVKNAFKSTLKTNADDLLEKLGDTKFEQLFNTDNVSTFKNLIEDINDPVYKFIKLL